MDMRTLEVFTHLSASLSFSRTSAACYISPSALSRSIQRLEDELGTRLFVRDNRSVTLTKEGSRFREFARETVERYRTTKDQLVQQTEHLTGEISIYCSVTAAQAVLSQIFQVFRTRHPGVHIHLETGDPAHAIDRVRDGSADLTVAARPERLPPGLEFRKLTETPVVFIGPSMPCEVTDLINQDPVPWNTVPMILAEKALSRRFANQWFQRKGILPEIYAEVAGHEAILAMVRLGCGAGIVPELVLDQSSLKNEVRIIPADPALPPYEVGVCMHSRKLQAPISRAFWEVAAGSPFQDQILT